MVKIAELNTKGGTMLIYYDKNNSFNHYSVYIRWNDLTDHGIVRRRRLVARYADLASAVYEFVRFANEHNEEHR